MAITTPHHTDGAGIGRKLKGAVLGERLKQLADNANQHHREAQECWQGLLMHARQAGEALLEAKRRLGHKSKWSKWRRDRFEGSKETACNYMRVARHWNNPIIKNAVAAGASIDSINKFLKVLRGQVLERKSTDGDDEQTQLRRQLQKSFAERLKELNTFELEVLIASFDEQFWPLMQRDLQGKVCQALEADNFNTMTRLEAENVKTGRCPESGIPIDEPHRRIRSNRRRRIGRGARHS